MRIQPLLSYVAVTEYTTKKISSLTVAENGEQYLYHLNETIYDYKNNSYYRLIREKSNIKIYDYKTGHFYQLKPKSSNSFYVNRLGSEEMYEIVIEDKRVKITNKKNQATKTFYFQ